jgi:hypothetical protein
VSKNILISLGLLSWVFIVPLPAEDYSKVNFDIGGGVSTPLNPTGQFAGISGNFITGGGYNIDKHNSIVGEFMWNGLPTNLTAIHPINAPSGNINLYSLTANYRYQAANISGSHFGLYLIGGGGWYYRHSSIDKNYVVPPGTVCQPIYGWWGYTCDTGGFVVSQTVAFRGSSAGGVNGGGGFTIRLSDSGWKFYIESRYNYAWNSRIHTAVAPVTFGLRFN